MSKMSSLSTTSCSPAEIKMRVKKQMSLQKRQERARLLKKGETSKYTAVRRDLKSQIKEDFWN
jgi:RIO kinase 2